jgi:hypothetical protein
MNLILKHMNQNTLFFAIQHSLFVFTLSCFHPNDLEIFGNNGLLLEIHFHV